MVTKKLMVTLVELYDHIWRLEKLKDKHHCNTLLIFMAEWPSQASPPCRHMKTNLEFAKKKFQVPSIMSG